MLPNDSNHQRYLDLMEGFDQKSYGELIISDYIADEVITVIWSKTQRKGDVIEAYNFMYDQEIFSMHKVDEKNSLQIKSKN